MWEVIRRSPVRARLVPLIQKLTIMSKTLQTNMQHCVEHDVYYNAAFWHCGLCFQQQKDMVMRLEESLKSWREAWFSQRTATGRMAWTVPNPFVLRRSDSPFFQKEYQRFLNFAEQLWAEQHTEPSNQILNLKEPVTLSRFEPDPFPSMRNEDHPVLDPPGGRSISGHWSFYQ